ncbi:methyltransferase [Marinobacter sp. 1Y8]
MSEPIAAASENSRHGQHWLALNGWLREHHELWQYVPFATPEPPWCKTYSALARRLETFDSATCDFYEQHPDQLTDLLSAELPALAERPSLVRLPDLSGTDLALAESRAVDMPGRKRLQAGLLAGAIQPLTHKVLDWCCGKGHLARTLAPSAPEGVAGLEWASSLVQQGNALARRYGDAVTLSEQDVLAPSLQMPADIHAVALHACGDLHKRLLMEGVRQRLPRISFSPCCYHLTRDTRHTPLSDFVSSQPDRLALSTRESRLAVQETVTAPAREIVQRECLRSWRLGFDGLQRSLRQCDGYLPVPSAPTHLNQGDFAGFCHWAAQAKGLSLPADVDYRKWQAYGEQRLMQVRQHELLQHVFRRPLELWLVLDYVLLLQEQGYQVRWGTFCERGMTPRNLLIDANDRISR